MKPLEEFNIGLQGEGDARAFNIGLQGEGDARAMKCAGAHFARGAPRMTSGAKYSPSTVSMGIKLCNREFGDREQGTRGTKLGNREQAGY